jgi:hypothetical protein
LVVRPATIVRTITVPHTRQGWPPEYLRVIEVTFLAAEVVDVSGEAGATCLDRAAEDSTNRGAQTAYLVLAQVAGVSPG